MSKFKKPKEEINFGRVARSGEYAGTLKIKMCELPKKTKVEGKLVDDPSGDTYAGLRWTFKLQALKNTWVFKNCSHTYKRDAGLHKMLQQARDSLLKEIVFNKSGYADEDDPNGEALMNRYMEEAENKTYAVSVEVNGPFASVLAFRPLKEGEVLPTDIAETETPAPPGHRSVDPGTLPQPSVPNEPVRFDDDDDIPF